MIEISDQLIDDLANLSNKPWDFTLWAYPWGEAGTELEFFPRPDVWQERVLRGLQSDLASGMEFGTAWSKCVKIAVRSGHGVGKSALIAMLVNWAISTMEDTRGRVTANTKEQLMRVLWGEVAKWHRLSICGFLFKTTATAIYSSDPAREKTWRIDAIAWSEDNPEAFAGLHNFGKRILIICDEASAIADVIWEVLDGATTDANTQIIWLVAGNPTRHSGRFRDCFDRFSVDRVGARGWRCYQVDSRDVSFSNKELIETWRVAWGEDSDFFRVRVRGEFPNAEMGGLFPLYLIEGAQSRPATSFHWEPLILGVDVSRFGSNETIAQFRRGNDARTVPISRWSGASTIESATRIAALMAQHEPDAVFIDEGGVGGGVVDALRSFGHFVIPVNFGAAASSRPGGVLVANKRAEMYVMLKQAMEAGLALPEAEDLREQLVAIEFGYDKKQQIQLMSKKDMKSLGSQSPDWADAIVLTYAFPVAQKRWRGTTQVKKDYDPLGEAAFRGKFEAIH